MSPTDIHGMALALGLPSALAQIEAVKQLVAEAVANEREECAKVCEEVGEHSSLTPQHCAESIRARGSNEAI